MQILQWEFPHRFSGQKNERYHVRRKERPILVISIFIKSEFSIVHFSIIIFSFPLSTLRHDLSPLYTTSHDQAMENNDSEFLVVMALNY